jgi:acetyltransferase-like isoleucine patch superfamily enzyme
MKYFIDYFFGCFFDKALFNSKYFTEQKIGYLWVLRSLFFQKIFRYNAQAKFPVSHLTRIDNPENIIFDYSDLQNFQHFGCYYSNSNGGKITIKKGTFIAPNVGIVTTNHQKNNLIHHDPPLDVTVGENCWIGMNSVILPGVCLGPGTIVGAGSVVTKSFPEGAVVIAGSPARIIEHVK